MSNMSYCRFENTLADLQDCEEAINVHGFYELSETELAYAKRLVECCKRIAADYDAHMADIAEAEKWKREGVR